MPVTRSATKKLRRDKTVTRRNDEVKRRYKRAALSMRKHPTLAHLKLASSMVDRAAKRRVIHANKAGRMKSALAQLLR